MSKAMIPLLSMGGEKTIINISSIGAQNLSRGASGYRTTKFALLRFTEFLNIDYRDEGLLANSVHPRGIPTDLAKVCRQMHSLLVSTYPTTHICETNRWIVLVDTVELASNTIVFPDKGEERMAGRQIC
jgi:NAD(P)-dependent dehydrogenase (short-subunit alcohol dehydrogenase family)